MGGGLAEDNGRRRLRRARLTRGITTFPAPGWVAFATPLTVTVLVDMLHVTLKRANDPGADGHALCCCCRLHQRLTPYGRRATRRVRLLRQHLASPVSAAFPRAAE